MNQYPPNEPQIPMDNQQQPQWQQQQQPQQPVPGIQHPQPQYGPMQEQDTAMPMYPPTQATPTLEAMYSQDQQPHQQPMPPVAQQNFPQQQSAFQGKQQMQQFPQQQHFGQQTQPNMPMNQDIYGEQEQQYPYSPDLSTIYEQTEGSRSAHPGFGPAATPWEQEHVTEVNEEPPFTGFNQPSGHQVPQNAVKATREAELFAARQRVQALEAEREEREFSRAMAISAREAPDDAALEEQLQQQLHQAQLLSLNAYEEDIRRQIEQQSNPAYNDDPYTPMASGAANQGFNYPDPRGGSQMYSPAPTLQGHNAAQQPQFHPPASHAAPSQAASGIYHPEIVSPTASHISQPNSYQGGPIPMPPPPMNIPGPNPAGSGDNFAWTPPPQTPTPGVPPEQAAGNLAAEDARRWEAYNRAQAMQQDGGRSATSTPSQYTGRSVYSPSISEASTVRNGSKGKGRMP